MDANPLPRPADLDLMDQAELDQVAETFRTLANYAETRRNLLDFRAEGNGTQVAIKERTLHELHRSLPQAIQWYP